MSVRIERDRETRACVVRMSGEIDLGVVPEIRDELGEIVNSGCVRVILDLAEVSYIDSTALGLLVWLDRQLAPFEGRLYVSGANPDVARILELSGLIGVAPTISARATVEDALAGLEHVDEGATPVWSESIVLPADVESLARVREAVVDLLESVGMSESALFDVKVAVGEALANAVRHGSPGGESDEVTVDVVAYEDRVRVIVRDSGHGFDGVEGVDGDDVFAAGGRGILFMRALMDNVEFSRDPAGGTAVLLEKHLRLRNGSEQVG
jgi:anti-anti-sigma factor